MSEKQKTVIVKVANSSVESERLSFGATITPIQDLLRGEPEPWDLQILYPDIEQGSLLKNASILIKDALEYIENALDSLEEDNIISSDNNVMFFQRLLPELFCFRSLGEGFSSIVNALIHSMNNKDGYPLNIQELSAVNYALRKLNDEIFMDYKKALSVLEHLEKNNLNIFPNILDDLGNFNAPKPETENEE